MTENNNNHVAEQIEAYLDEELSAAERIAFDAHIASCETCRALLDESRQTRAELRSLFASAHPSDSFEDRMIEGFRMGTSRRLHWVQPSVRRAAFAAAAAVLLVGTGIAVSRSLNTGFVGVYSVQDLLPSSNVPAFDPSGRSNLSDAIRPRLLVRDSDGDGIPDSKLYLRRGALPTEGASKSRGYGEVADLKKSAEQVATTSLDARLYGSKRAEDRAAGAADKPYFASGGKDGTFTDQGVDNIYRFQEESKSLKDGAAKPLGWALGLPVPGDKAANSNPATVITQYSEARFRNKADAAERDQTVTGKVELKEPEQTANKNAGTDVAKQQLESLKDKPDDEKATGRPAEVQYQPAEPATQAAILGRKIIRNANMQFEVERFDDALLRLTKLVTEQGGFVAGTDSDKLPNGKMRGTITLRVPPEHLETLVLELRGIGDLKSQKIGAEDVTRHYTDLESSLRAAHAMQDRLLEIIKSGKGQIKDLLEAEKQLGIWREKSEQIEGEKRYLDNLVSLSTLTLEMAERDIRQAAVATESEQVAMSLETEAVDKAYTKARQVIESAKGRILQSEMKQLDAGQFGGTIRAAISPDVAEQVIAGLRQLDGRIAHFSRESHRTTQEGEASVATANTVRHDDTIVAIQIYNLANIAPRRTTNIVIAIGDVEKAYQKLLADIQSAGGHVLTSSLTRPDANQQTGEIQVQLPTEKADALELAASSLGETLRHESTENPDGANVTDAKRGFHFIVVSLTTIAARETRQIGLVATTVSSAFESIRQAVVDAGGRITQSELNDQGADGQTGVLSFDVPRTNLQTITGAIDKSTVLLSQSASRSPDTQNTIDSKLRFSLTISSAQKLAPRQTVSLGSEVTDVNAAVAALTTAADTAGGRRVDTGGVSQDPTTTTAELIVEVPADHAQAIIQQIEQGGRTFNKHVTFDPNAPQGALSRARIQATFSDSARNLGGQESGWDAMRRGLETSATGLRWSLQMLVIGACFVAPWVFVIWIGWKFLRRKPRKAATA